MRSHNVLISDWHKSLDSCTRRRAIVMIGAAACRWSLSRVAKAEEILGFRVPDTRICRDTQKFAFQIYPPYLLNHCMRTYYFGVFHARRHRLKFDAEVSFVAAALHDVGLLEKFEEVGKSFELSGADAAEKFASEHSMGKARSAKVWNAVAFHDLNSAIIWRQRSECFVVAAGAAADVVGPDKGMLSDREMTAVLRAYPRLDFKKKFLASLDAHCIRQLNSQDGTWLGTFCADLDRNSRLQDRTRLAIEEAPFSE